MKISCVMSIYNEEIWMIHRAISSVLRQSVYVDELIVVVDNPEYEEGIKAVQKLKEPRIKILVNDKNIGLAATLNRGFAEANGELIMRMDADDESLPERLEHSIKLMQEENADIVTTRVVLVDEFGDYLSEQRVYPCTHEAIARISKHCACLFHPTWLLKKKVWEEVGGYRPAMISAQDYDFIIRAIKLGFKVNTVPEPLLRYTIRKNSISGAHTAQQAFLALYAQDNVYRNKPFSFNIGEDLKYGRNNDFTVFKKFFDGFYSNMFFGKKIVLVGKAIICSKYFRRYIYNAVIQKLLVRYYNDEEV